MAKCDKCQKCFKTELILTQHKKDSHNEKKKFVKYVIKNLPENKPFQCEICKKDFARPTQMNSHKKVVH